MIASFLIEARIMFLIYTQRAALGKISLVQDRLTDLSGATIAAQMTHKRFVQRFVRRLTQTTALIGLLAGLAGVSGCIHSPIAMMTSTKPLAPGGYEELGPASDSDCLWSLFGFIPVTSGNSLRGALAGAISKRDGADALIQVSADWFYQNWILLSRTCTQVDGIAVRSKPQ